MSSLKPNAYFTTRYLLVRRIGVGGYSEVWLANDTLAGNMQVALKIFAPDKGLDEQGVALFSKEYALVFNLNHPNLLLPKHFDVSGGSPFLVLPYCEAGSVFSKIGSMTEADLARFLQQAASALAYLHSQEPPIIHQDIKPDNFLIDNQGNYLLSDFGISSKIRRTLTRSMGANASVGTLAYMPPEKFSAERLSVKAGDIFSLGVTIYELLTGDLPFGEHGGLLLLNGAQVPVLTTQVNVNLSSLVIHCLSKDPATRPTASEMLNSSVVFEKPQYRPTVEINRQSINTLTDDLEVFQAFNGKKGYRNKNTKVEVVSPTYDYAEAFYDGMAKIGKKVGFWKKMAYGFVGESGLEIVPAQFEDVSPFSEGLAFVHHSRNWSVINKKGMPVFSLKDDEYPADVFDNGMARIYQNYGIRMNLVDKSGKVLIDMGYNEIQPFSMGLAKVKYLGKLGLINIDFNQIVSCAYDTIGDFSCQRALVSKSNGLLVTEKKYGYIDVNGNEVIPLIYTLAFGFENGLAKVHQKNQKYLIDVDGNIVEELVDGKAK